ncbi:MAG: hypothetical protein J1F20_07155 [Muribaculaceae bacterium]|nr:hypothetical protein [Muribaculaceae bacterium]
MKKFLLPAVLMVLAGTAANAQQANVYASQVKATASNEVSMILNTDATKVVIEFLDNQGNVVGSEDLGAGKKGLNTFAVNPTGVESGTYAYRIVCEAPAVTEATLLTADLPDELNVTTTRTVCVDFYPQSPAFGTVYVGSTAYAPTADGNPTYPGKRIAPGIYTYSADLTPLTEEPYAGGQEWGGNSSPSNVKVSSNGEVFVCDWTDGHAGVWVMDPMNPGADWKSVFAEGERNADGLLTINGVNVAGSVQDLAVYGEGENRVLWTQDEDINGNAHEIFVYNIGNLETPWSTAPTACLGDNSGYLLNANHRIHADQRGGAWVSQYRWEEGETLPVLSHFNAKGEWDFKTGDKTVVLGSAPAGAMGVNSDGSLIVVADADAGHGKHFRVVKAEYDSEGLPTLELLYTVSLNPYGTRPMCVAFDAADNVYISFNNVEAEGGVGVWALPKEENKYTTLANDEIVLGESGVNAVTADNNVAPVYYDMMGRKVNNPEAGKLYIEVRGEKATKVNF